MTDATRDSITIMITKGRVVATKRITLRPRAVKPEIHEYDRAKHFSIREVPAGNIWWVPRADGDLRPGLGPDLSRVQIRAGDYAQESFARAMSHGILVGNAVAHYARLCRGAPALVYCVGIDHLELVAQSARTAGFRLRHVDGEMPKDERRDAVAALGAGDLNLLTNCGLFSESTDVPALGAVILLRPTSICKYSASDFVATAEECPECGAFLEPRRRTIEGADGALDEISPLALDLRGMSYRELLTWADSDAGRLRLAARVRGCKAGWVWHVQQTHRRSEP